MFLPQFLFVRGAPSRKRKLVIVSEMEHKFCIVLYHKQVREDALGIFYYIQLPSFKREYLIGWLYSIVLAILLTEIQRTSQEFLRNVNYGWLRGQKMLEFFQLSFWKAILFW